jgi:Cytochrome P460
MRWFVIAALCASAIASIGAAAPASEAPATSPIYGVALPEGYRQWQLVGVAQETGSLDELRATVGNPQALEAYRSGALPFPDGTVLVKLAWKRLQSTAFAPAFVPGAATTVQVMVKDSKRYAATGGWGFGRFIDGHPADEAQHETCFACHQANAQGHDFVFTHFAP